MRMYNKLHSNWIIYNQKTRRWEETESYKYNYNHRHKNYYHLWWQALENKQYLELKCLST